MHKGSLALGLVVGTVALIVVTTMGAYVILKVNGVQTDDFTTGIMPMILPTLASLFVLVRVEKVSTDVEKVREQTNGHMTQLIDTVAVSAPVKEVPTHADQHNH